MRSLLRALLIASALLLTLASSGCVSQDKYDKDVNAAFANGRSQGRAEGAEAERKAAEDKIQRVTEEAQAEVQKVTADSNLKLERLREQVEVEKQQLYIKGYGDASSGRPLAVYEPLETTSGLVLVLFYFSIALLIIGTGAAVLGVVSRAGRGRDRLIRVLPLVLSGYAWFRFIRPPGESCAPGFRGAISYSGLVELGLIIISLMACHACLLLIKSNRRRLLLDFLAVFLAGVVFLLLTEFGFNASSLVRLGSPIFALRLALAPVIGAVAYTLLYAGKVIVRRSEPETEQADQAGGKPRGRRLF